MCVERLVNMTEELKALFVSCSNAVSKGIARPRMRPWRWFLAYSEQILMQLVKAPVSGHPREAEIVSVTGTGRLPEWANTKTVWEPGKNGNRQGGRK